MARKGYSPQVVAIVKAAQEMAEERRRAGWTREDALKGLKRMLDSNDGDDGYGRVDVDMYTLDRGWRIVSWSPVGKWVWLEDANGKRWTHIH